jgi:hypothetical protein
MATKSFYTLEEAAKRMGKSTEQVNEIANTGKLTRVSHEGQTKFRVEQVEILVSSANNPHSDEIRLSGDSHSGVIGLADSTSGSAPAVGGPGRKSPSPMEDSVLGLADSTPRGAKLAHDSSEQTGISALSGRGRGGDAIEIGLETVGSGSGLLDLTRESEETALGAELIDQVYSSEGDANPGASGLFESVSRDPTLGASAPSGAAGMIMAEPYDGAWSGVGAGVLVAAFAGIVVAGLIAVSVILGGGSAVASSFSGNIMAWAGSLAGITAIFGLVGFFIGRASE